MVKRHNIVPEDVAGRRRRARYQVGAPRGIRNVANRSYVGMTSVSIILMASTADYTVEVRTEGLRKREWSPTSSTSYSTKGKYLSPSREMYDGLSRLTSLFPHHKDFFLVHEYAETKYAKTKEVDTASAPRFLPQHS
jgi:hypothetical protein